jgi:hypothetical protein
MRKSFLAAVFLIATMAIAEADIRVSVDQYVRGADSIARYIERLGTRYLAPNQKLDITILDYRRARGGSNFGRPYGFGPRYGFGPGFGYGRWRDPFYDLDRFDRGRPGRLTVSYSLRDRGKVVASNTETITSWGDRFGSGYGYSGSLSDDRDEVRRWFRKRFGSRANS